MIDHTVHVNVQLHPKVPLLPLPGLVHVRVTHLVDVLGGTRCSNDGGIHNGSGVELEASRLQFLAYLDKQGFAQFVVVEQFRNLVMVVESGTGSRPRSMPTKLRRLALS